VPGHREIGFARILRHNVYMADVPVYVAVITAAAGIVGAVIPQAGIVLREVRQAERDRRERSVTAAQTACIDLLRAASSLGTQVENLRDYRGDAGGLRLRLEKVRKCLDETQLHAASVGMLAPDQLIERSSQLAAEAGALVKAVEANIDLDNDVVVGRIEVGPLDTLVAAFRSEAVRLTRG
jgi:hypothetical protein